MGKDPTEFPAYFHVVENLSTSYEVPSQLQSKFVILMLNERSKSLLVELSKERLDDYKQVHDYTCCVNFMLLQSSIVISSG